MAQRRRRQPSNVYGQILQQGKNPLDQMMQQLLMMQRFQTRQGDSERAQLQRMGIQRGYALDDRDHAGDIRQEGREEARALAMINPLLAIGADTTRSPEEQELDIARVESAYGVKAPGGADLYKSTPANRVGAFKSDVGGTPAEGFRDPEALVSGLARQHHLGEFTVDAPIQGPPTSEGEYGITRRETSIGTPALDYVEAQAARARGETDFGLSLAGLEAGERDLAALPTEIFMAELQGSLNRASAEASAQRNTGTQRAGTPFEMESPFLEDYWVTVKGSGDMFMLPKGSRAAFTPTGLATPAIQGYPQLSGIPVVESKPILLQPSVDQMHLDAETASQYATLHPDQLTLESNPAMAQALQQAMTSGGSRFVDLTEAKPLPTTAGPTDWQHIVQGMKLQAEATRRALFGRMPRYPTLLPEEEQFMNRQRGR
jgi:hypothetical protein